MQYPKIAILVTSHAKTQFQTNKFLLDLDWVTSELYLWQDIKGYPLESAKTVFDLIYIAERIANRSQWDISHQQYEQALKNFRSKP